MHVSLKCASQIHPVIPTLESELQVCCKKLFLKCPLELAKVGFLGKKGGHICENEWKQTDALKG